VIVRQFSELSEKEILALAITLEEEHSRIFSNYADGLEENYPASARVFAQMAEEEDSHRGWLMDMYRERFGDHITLIRRQDVKGFVRHKPIWLMRPLGLDSVRRQAEEIEYETRLFYERALSQTTDINTRKLLGDLIAAERGHESLAQQLSDTHLTEGAVESEEQTRHRMFVLQVVQPGLAGLMDGSVSTLAPLFAAAFSTHDTWATFLVGVAASVGAGISMGFAEALSDDGSLTGRGHPWLRGTVTGIMTTIGGLGHTVPYLLGNFKMATAVAIFIVFLELWAIAWIRARYMDTKFLRAAFEVVLGGVIVFAAGVLIGSA
jgi:rubrerythrin